MGKQFDDFARAFSQSREHREETICNVVILQQHEPIEGAKLKDSKIFDKLDTVDRYTKLIDTRRLK